MTVNSFSSVNSSSLIPLNPVDAKIKNMQLTKPEAPEFNDVGEVNNDNVKVNHLKEGSVKEKTISLINENIKSGQLQCGATFFGGSGFLIGAFSMPALCFITKLPMKLIVSAPIVGLVIGSAIGAVVGGLNK